MDNTKEPLTQKSTVSTASKAKEQTMEEDNHFRLPTNISTTKNNTMPNTPQSS